MQVTDISYLTNEKGRKTGLFLPIKVLEEPAVLQDWLDVAISKNRLENESAIDFE